MSAQIRTIEPSYGFFYRIKDQDSFDFVVKNIATQDFLPEAASEGLQGTFADQSPMTALHDSKSPFYLPPESGSDITKRLLVWVDSTDPSNIDKMVLIIEAEQDIHGLKLIYPDQMLVGSSAAVVAQVKMSCLDDAHAKNQASSGEAPFSAVVCIPQQGQLSAKITNPAVASIAGGHREMFPGGITTIAPGAHAAVSKMVQDLAQHVNANKPSAPQPSKPRFLRRYPR